MSEWAVVVLFGDKYSVGCLTLSCHPAYLQPVTDMRDAGNLGDFSLADYNSFDPARDNDFLIFSFEVVSYAQKRARVRRPTTVQVRFYLRASRTNAAALDFAEYLRILIQAHMDDEDLEKFVAMLTTALLECRFCHKIWIGELLIHFTLHLAVL